MRFLSAIAATAFVLFAAPAMAFDAAALPGASDTEASVDRVVGARGLDIASPALVNERVTVAVERMLADNSDATDIFGDDFGSDEPVAAAAPAIDASKAADGTAAVAPVIPDGWTGHDKLGMGFAAPADYELKRDEDDEFVVTNSDMKTPKGCAVMGRFDNEGDPTDDMPPGAAVEKLAERDLGYGVSFTVTRMTVKEEDIDFQALAVFSKQPFNEDEDYFQFVVSCANEPTESAQALMDGVLGSLYLTSEPVLPVPESEKPKLGGLVTGSPPNGWTNYRSNDREWIIIAPNMQAAANFRLGSDALSALRDLAPERRFSQFAEDPAPVIEYTTMLGAQGWLFRGRVAPDDPERGIYNGGMEGPQFYFVTDRCTLEGDALVLSVAAYQSWIDRGNSLDPLLDGIVVHWPEGETACSEKVAAAREAAIVASRPNSASAVVDTAADPLSQGRNSGGVSPVAPAAGSGTEANWTAYTDPRYGTSITYPADVFVVRTEASDHQGIQIATADDTAELKIGGFVADAALAADDLMREMLASPEIDTLTGMNRISDTSFRLDGIHKGQHVTQIVALSGGNVVNMFGARYSDNYVDLIESVAGTFHVVVPEPETPAPSGAAATDPSIELAFWDAIKDSADPADFQAYLDQFPDGSFASLARIRITRLGGGASQPAPVAAPTPEPIVPLIANMPPETLEGGYDWQVYTNARFGIVIEYPVDMFRPLPPPTNNDGRRFEAADGSAGFYVFGQHNALDQSLQELYDSDRASAADESITYAKLGQGWYVVSGFRGQDIFYRKTLLSGDGVLRVFEIYYPKRLKAGFDDIVTRMASSFGSTAGADSAVSTVPGPNGTYSSDWGDVGFATSSSGAVTADYEGGKSHLVGQMNATRFEGTWHEPMATYQCSDDKYWGRLTLDFAADFGSFSGLWSYCEATPNRAVKGSLKSTATQVSPPVAPIADPVPSLGPFTTPARGTQERKDIMDAARGPVAADIGQQVIFVVDILRSDGHWAYLQASPLQPNGKPMDWTSTRYAADWQADAMSDLVMVLLSKDGGSWHTVDHIVGPTDVYWYGWVDQYQLPETLFQE